MSERPATPNQEPDYTADAEESAETSSLPFDLMTEELDLDILQFLLTENRLAIHDAIEAQYQESLRLNPGAEVHRPPFLVGRLHSDKKRVLSEAGRENDTGIHRNIDAIKEAYHPLWLAVEASGYVAEVNSTFVGPGVGGAWLLLREWENGDTS